MLQVTKLGQSRGSILNSGLHTAAGQHTSLKTDNTGPETNIHVTWQEAQGARWEWEQEGQRPSTEHTKANLQGTKLHHPTVSHVNTRLPTAAQHALE